MESAPEAGRRDCLTQLVCGLFGVATGDELDAMQQFDSAPVVSSSILLSDDGRLATNALARSRTGRLTIPLNR
jgi:hypothetical protein